MQLEGRRCVPEEDVEDEGREGDELRYKPRLHGEKRVKPVRGATSAILRGKGAIEYSVIRQVCCLHLIVQVLAAILQENSGALRPGYGTDDSHFTKLCSQRIEEAGESCLCRNYRGCACSHVQSGIDVSAARPWAGLDVRSRVSM